MSPLPERRCTPTGGFLSVRSTSGDDIITGWTSGANSRGTWDILVSCVLTLTLCVWSALHLNVPAPEAKLRHRFLERAKWVLYGIIAPEFVVAVAASQYLTAKWLEREIKKDKEYRDGARTAACEKVKVDTKSSESFRWRSLVGIFASSPLTKGGRGSDGDIWSITQCNFAAMGGFVTHIEGSIRESSPRRITLTPEGIRMLSLDGELPRITDKEIEDKSKADSLAKTIVVTQATWMLIQVIARAAAHLPISLLEINTCGHVVCALVLYLLWWNKPLDIHDPVVLQPLGHGDAGRCIREDTLDLMYLCSSISRTGKANAIRCFMYVPPHQSPGDSVVQTPPTPSPRRMMADRSPEATALSHGQDTTTSRASEESKCSETLWETTFSVGSRAAQNMLRFLGLETNKPLYDDTGSVRVTFRAPRRISPECRSTYFRLEYSGLSLQHSVDYCRRAAAGEVNEELDPGPFAPIPPSRLHSASMAVDRLWDVCSERKDYRLYYFTELNRGSLIPFLGETDYLVSKADNRPPLWKLSLGQVNLHRDVLPAIFAVTAAAYGGLHCTAWERHFFPSKAERMLWIASALAISASGLAMLAVFLGRCLLRWISRRYAAVKRFTHAQRGGMALLKLLGCLSLALFAVARIYIVTEAFASLRRAPEGLYIAVEWSDWLPHL